MNTNELNCEGKIRYNRPKNAMVVMQKILASGRIIDRLGFYRCNVCNKYHITKKFGNIITNYR
jgi:hypothetical protein